VAIDRLSSTANLIAALRAEITRESEKVRGQSARSATRGERAQSAARHDVAALRRELTEIVKNVSSDDQQAMDSVRPRIIRSVLLWEFGAELREHSEWQPMLDTLVRTLENDNRHREAFAQMVRELQR
jgi:hypothetical protein